MFEKMIKITILEVCQSTTRVDIDKYVKNIAESIAQAIEAAIS